MVLIPLKRWIILQRRKKFQLVVSIIVDIHFHFTSRTSNLICATVYTSFSFGQLINPWPSNQNVQKTGKWNNFTKFRQSSTIYSWWCYHNWPIWICIVLRNRCGHSSEEFLTIGRFWIPSILKKCRSSRLFLFLSL